MRRFIFIALSILSLMIFVTGCGTGSLTGTSVGVLGGIANLNNGGGSPVTYGLDVARHTGAFSPGITYNALTPNSQTINGASYNQGLSNLYLHVELMLGDLGIGVLGGINWWNNSSPGATNTTGFVDGIMAHWDWDLAKNISIGPRVETIWNNQSGAYNETDYVATLKYWFP